MPKIAHLNRDHAQNDANAARGGEKLTETVRATAEAGANAARESVQLAQDATDAVARKTADVAETLYGATRKLAEDAPEFSRDFAELLAEQTQQNADALNALARAVTWTDVAEVQSKLIAGSFLRFSRFNARYGAFLLRGMTATAASPRR